MDIDDGGEDDIIDVGELMDGVYVSDVSDVNFDSDGDVVEM